MILWLSKHSPSLLPVQRRQKPWDRVFLVLFVLGFLGWLAFMGCDAARTGFTAMPPWLQALGGLGVAIHMVGHLVDVSRKRLRRTRG
jgi:hypothetical protein